ncbi:MAG: hypothetical protein IJP65_09840 [Bacteroidales bacterium]|nr:hypothetical protein [Bacteroidales bacterium]
MKKILLVLAVIIGLSTSANAQVCKISNSNDNVEIFSAVIENDNTVAVTVGNDSQSVSANVTVEVEVTYKDSYPRTKTKKFYGKNVAKPNTTTIVKIPIDSSYPDSSYKPVSVKALNITGTKCMQ